MNCIRRYAADDAYIIYGAAFDDTLGDQLRVTVIATGLSQAKRVQTPLTVVQSNTVQRTGTDNVPVQHQPAHNGAAAPVQAAAPDYGAYATPSVWRSNRAQAAARVEALSSNGMDEIEIPAFLRKQAD
jgi:cell division protein FtsZ